MIEAKELGRLIDNYARHGFSYRDIARALGITTMSLYNWRHARHRPHRRLSALLMDRREMMEILGGLVPESKSGKKDAQ